MLFASRKREWLYCRLMTERIRQFHFQTLVFRLPQILASLKDEAARSEFFSQRTLWLASFKQRLVGKLDLAFASTIREEEEIDAWLHDSAKKRERDTVPEARISIPYLTHTVTCEFYTNSILQITNCRTTTASFP